MKINKPTMKGPKLSIPKKSRSRSRSRGRSGSKDRQQNQNQSKSKSRSRSRSWGRRPRSQSGDRSQRSNGDRSQRSHRKEKLMANYDQYESGMRPWSADDGVDELEFELPLNDEDDDGGIGLPPRRSQSRKQPKSKMKWPHARARSRSPGRARGGGGGGGNNKTLALRPFSKFQRPTRRTNTNTNTNNRRGGGDYGGDEETAGGRSRSSVRSRSSARSRTSTARSLKKDEHQYQFKAHPWILPPSLRIAPRIDVWFAFAVASCAAVASIGQIHASSTASSSTTIFSGWDLFALSTCVISFIFSFAIALGMRYAPLRTGLTRQLLSMRHHGQLSALNPTAELLVLSLLMLLWVIAIPIVVNGNAYYTAKKEIALAMAGSSIWNANLFYSSWASFLLCAYLWVEVATLSDRRGTLRVSHSRPGSKDSNTFTKRWTFLFLVALIILSAASTHYNGPACQGSLLKSTNYCTRALWGILVGGLLQIFVVLAVGALYRLSHMSLSNSRNRGGNANSSMLPPDKLDMGTGIAAIVTLAVQAISTGLLTSPTGGGPGNISGTLYFGSWLGLILAFELCLRYLERLSTRSVVSLSGRGDRSLASDREATVFEDDEGDEESLYTSKSASVASGKKSRAVVANSYLALNNAKADTGTALVEVEDVTIDDEEEVTLDDQASFVFPRAESPSARSKGQASVRTERSKGERSTSSKERKNKSRSKERKNKSSKPPPTEYPHQGGGIDPDDTSDQFRSSGRSDPSEGSVSTNASKFDPVGSIDARSQRRRSSDDDTSSSLIGSIRTNKKSAADPDGASINYKKSMVFGSSDFAYIDDEEEDDSFRDIDNDAFFHPTRDPTASHMHKPSFTSFHMDQVEMLDDSVQHQREPPPNNPGLERMASAATPRHPSNISNLSPLQEGSAEEISPNTNTDNESKHNLGAGGNDNNTARGLPSAGGESSAAVPTTGGQSRAIGDNLKTMQAMRGPGMAQQPQQQQHSVNQADRSKKSGSSSGKRSGASSRKKGLDNLVAGMYSGQGNAGYGSGGGGAPQASKHSKASSASKKSKGCSISTMSRSQAGGEDNSSVILTDHSEAGGGASSHGRKSSSKYGAGGTGSRRSARSMRSASTMSSRGAGDQSAILTDDESGSNPPPTISDGGMSTKDGLSEFSELSKTRSGSGSRNNNKAAPQVVKSPPPPPFLRPTPPQQQQQQNHQDDLYNDTASQYSSSAPVRSIHTNKGSHGGSSDTIVSDPTLDPGLATPRSPKPMPKATGKTGIRHHDSSSTNSYDKKYSDETDIHHSSDDNPSSHEGGGAGGNKVVDNIVAAALAYAEKTHGEPDGHGAGAAVGSGRPPQPRSFHSGAGNRQVQQQQQQQPGRKQKGQFHRASTATDESSSIHSFYTETSKKIGGAGGGGGGGGDRSNSTGNRYSVAAPVDDLVAQALSHARGQLESEMPHQKQQRPFSISLTRSDQQSQSQNNPSSQPQQRPLAGSIPSMPRNTSGHSSGHYGSAGKSVGSMYSEDDTEFSNQDVGQHFDC